MAQSGREYTAVWLADNGPRRSPERRAPAVRAMPLRGPRALGVRCTPVPVEPAARPCRPLSRLSIGSSGKSVNPRTEGDSDDGTGVVRLAIGILTLAGGGGAEGRLVSDGAG